LVKRQLITGTTVPALLLSKSTICQLPGTARKVASPILTMGTVGPAVIGTAASGATEGRCVTRLDIDRLAKRIEGEVGGRRRPLCWPTLSGVGSVRSWDRGTGTPGVDGMSTLLRGACASAADAIARPARQPRITIVLS
jgi:hypothetical protein